jgi:hypothetical protein
LSRLLIIDESLSNRISAELVKRGRRSESNYSLGLTRRLDRPLIEKLSLREDEWVLVTGDDRMPEEHAEIIARTGATIATVDGRWEPFCKLHSLQIGQAEFQWDTVHRWAHVIAEQPERTIRRYNPLRHSPWTKRTRYAG